MELQKRADLIKITEMQLNEVMNENRLLASQSHEWQTVVQSLKIQLEQMTLRTS